MVQYYCLKGTFQQSGDETHQTKSDGTDANGEEITFTGITVHKFTKTGSRQWLSQSTLHWI